MDQPQYTWWPWRVLAAAVGLVAYFASDAMCAAGALSGDVWDAEQALRAVSLTVFAGGNALVLGMAIGDLGRSLLVLIVAVGVALFFSFLPSKMGFIAPFAIMPFVTAALSANRSLRGFLRTAVLGLGATLLGGVIFLQAWCVLGFVASWICRTDTAMAFSLPIAVACGNTFLVGLLFGAAHRVYEDQMRGGVGDEDVSLPEKHGRVN
jgi:hypothetical protein